MIGRVTLHHFLLRWRASRYVVIGSRVVHQVECVMAIEFRHWPVDLRLPREKVDATLSTLDRLLSFASEVAPLDLTTSI